MGSILRATLILGSGSAVSLLVSLLANKAYAVWVGPQGMGLLGLLQGLLGIAAIVAGMGLSSGLVRLGAPEVAANNPIKIIALHQAAWQLFGYFAGAAGLILLLFSQPIAQFLLAGSPAWTVIWVVLALFLSLAAGVQIGLLNAYHRVGVLARITAISSVFGAIFGVTVVYIWRAQAMPLVLLGVPLAQLVLASYFTKGLSLRTGKADLEQVRLARGQLLRFGLPFTGSQLVGSAVQLGLPFLVLHQLGQEEVGYYRAAVVFSTGYIGFLLNALGQDFYPRLSALKDQPEAFRTAIHAQQRFILLIGSPLVALSIALAPLIITTIFSKAFLPTVSILHSQLLGDLLKFISWTLGFAVLAGLPSRFYLFSETVGGGFLLGLSWWGMQRFGLQGLGIGYLASYAVYLTFLVWLLGRQKIWLPAWNNIWLLLLGFGIALGVRFLPEPWGLLLALVWAVSCMGLMGRQLLRSRARAVQHG